MTSEETTERAAVLEKRTWVYVMRPREYEISGCECGNSDPDWSEYKAHLWCETCQKDFIPASDGIFDGPIPVNCVQLMGISLDRFNLQTQLVDKFPYLQVSIS